MPNQRAARFTYLKFDDSWDSSVGESGVDSYYANRDQATVTVETGHGDPPLRCQCKKGEHVWVAGGTVFLPHGESGAS